MGHEPQYIAWRFTVGISLIVSLDRVASMFLVIIMLTFVNTTRVLLSRHTVVWGILSLLCVIFFVCHFDMII